MNTISRWLLVFGTVIVVLALFSLLIPSPSGHTSKPRLRVAAHTEPGSPESALMEAEYAALLQRVHGDGTLSSHPAALEETAIQEDPCLHCHLSGEDTNVWTPVARWTLFGAAGLVFAFGIYRHASVWRKRQPWTPLTARAMDWLDERYDIRDPLAKILSKPVPKYARHWMYCLGGITFILFVIQAITGIMLAFYYDPTPDGAFTSIEYIENEVYFGAAIRAIHHWAANGMIVMCIAHMIRVFITGAYRAPRELNWIGGMLLLIMTLAFGFTGYLLPWDQRAFWATTVGTDIVGGVPDFGPLALVFLRSGWTVSAETLSRFFAVHVIILPILTILLMGLHFLMVRRQGIAEPL